MNKLLFFLLFIVPIFSFARDYEVKIQVQNLPKDSKPVLLKIYNGELFVLDSLAILNNETITFKVPQNTNIGMLRTILGISPYARYTNGQPTSITFLFNHEDIEMAIDFDKPQETLRILKSKENQIYFDYLNQEAVLFQKLRILEQVVTDYPSKDEFHKTALGFYRKFQLEREKLIDKFESQYKKTLAGKIIATKKLPLIAGDTEPAVRDSIYKNSFLEKISFTDTTLLYTNVYTDKIYQYIQMHMQQNASPRENEANIILAVDRLVPHLDANQNIQQHLMQFLIAGFEISKLEEVLAHISQNYMQQCGGSGDIIKRRLEGYQKMAIGRKVPDFTVMDVNNNPYNLYGSINPYTLIVFWHTDCDHCKLLTAQLPELFEEDFFKKHQVKIVGISIDENKEAWKEFSADHPMDWINGHVEGGFDSKIASDYNLFATPSMFLLNETNTIIAKPTTFEELKKNISDLK